MTALAVFSPLSPVPSVAAAQTDATPASGGITGNILARRVAAAPLASDGTILVSDFTVAAGQAGTEVTLEALKAVVHNEDAFADPSLRDQVEVVLTKDVAARLADLGIDDPVAHFTGRTLQVRGERKLVVYTGFPALLIYTVKVSRLEDIKVTRRAAAHSGAAIRL